MRSQPAPPGSAPATIRAITPLPRRDPGATDLRVFGRTPCTTHGRSATSAPIDARNGPDRAAVRMLHAVAPTSRLPGTRPTGRSTRLPLDPGRVGSG